MIRLTSLLCLLTLSFMMMIEDLEFQGQLMGNLLNLPHRSLGLLHWCMVAEPQRSDFARNYIMAYKTAVDNEWLLEGQRRPVIDMLAVQLSREFPNDVQLQTLQRIIMHNHFARLEQEKETKK
jgi:hypothetical protein